VFVFLSGLVGFPLTVSGLAKVAIFTTNVDAENQSLINHKCVCGVPKCHFCQARVIASGFHNIGLIFFINQTTIL
jgi:hypothetical protein